MTFKTLFVLFSSTVMFRPGLAVVTSHIKCRGGIYPRSNVERFYVPDDKVGWTSEYNEYQPPFHTASSIHGKPWADPEIDEPQFKPKWNSVDGNVSRISYTGQYDIVNGYPRNPIGRTGIRGRGILGRWGPNHAADPVVTRWKRDDVGDIVLNESQKPVLQFVAIKRGDTGEWALPGGMVDPGEKVNATAVREFQEEAINSLEMSKDEIENWRKKFKKFFSNGDIVYKGYIDDRRNTDNAWMETMAYNFHDESGSIVGTLKLNAGDDAVGVQWIDVTPDLGLYASHKDIVMKVLSLRLSSL